MASGSGNERSREKYYVSEVLSLLHLDDTQSGSDLDYDEFNNSATESDTENPNIVESMDTSDGNATDVPIVQKKRKLQTPGVTEDREWVDITDKKNDKLTDGSFQDFTEIGGPTKDIAEDAPAVYYYEQYFCADTGTTLWDMLVTETNKYYTRYVIIYYKTK